MVETTFPEWINSLIFVLGVFVVALVSLGLIITGRSYFKNHKVGIVLSGLVVSWFVIILVLISNGIFHVEDGQRSPILLIALISPIAGSYIIYRSSKTVQQFIFSIPLHWLTVIHVARIGGILFLYLMVLGILPAVFALPAGVGDFTAGILAIPASYMLWKMKKHARKMAAVATIFGIGDLVVAISIGNISSAGSSISNTLLVLIPTFLVPLFLIAHMFTIVRLQKNKL
ncbi:MAG: hypothetical protein IIA19_07950 [Thaumarchaeota archaeon]|nr:hypothetical protein [Nitrososphaerota archaeon]